MLEKLEINPNQIFYFIYEFVFFYVKQTRPRVPIKHPSSHFIRIITPSSGHQLDIDVSRTDNILLVMLS